MARQTTVGNIQVADLIESLRKLGADTAALTASVGLPATPLQDPAARVPAGRVLDLLEAAERQLGDPLVGLHAGARVETRGPLFYLLLSSRRASEGLALFSRFARVALDTLDHRVRVRDGVVELTVVLGDPALARSHHAIDYITGANLSSLRRAIPDFRLIDVGLTHPEVGERGETARTFGCPVRFAQRFNTVRFPDSTLTGVPAGANPAIAEQIQKLTAAVFTQITAQSVQDRAADAIRALLVAGLAPDRAAVAHRLHVSERTLQRQLEQEAVTFKSLRDGVRLEISRALLSNRGLKIEAVAQSVGFAEAASFSRAFSRWVGHPPARFRDRLDCQRSIPARAARQRGEAVRRGGR